MRSVKNSKNRAQKHFSYWLNPFIAGVLLALSYEVTARFFNAQETWQIERNKLFNVKKRFPGEKLNALKRRYGKKNSSIEADLSKLAAQRKAEAEAKLAAQRKAQIAKAKAIKVNQEKTFQQILSTLDPLDTRKKLIRSYSTNYHPSSKVLNKDIQYLLIDDEATITLPNPLKGP